MYKDGVYKDGEVGDSIGYKAIGGGLQKDEEQYYKDLFKANEAINDQATQQVVSDIQRVGSVILGVVFVSVLVSVVVVVAVLAWLR